MFTRRLHHTLSISVLGSFLTAACGDESQEPPPPKKEAVAPLDSKEPLEAIESPKADVPAEEEWADTDDAIPSPDSAGAPDSGGDTAAADTADDTAAAGGGEGGADPAPEPTAFAGPCAVKWSTGASLKFEYDNGGGKVRVDQDGDAKAETCAAFEYAQGRTTKVRIDEGCDGSFETTIEPSYDGKSNVASATLSSSAGGSQQTRDVTLVTLPGYVGLTPGYLLQAPRKSVRLKSSKGLVRSAKVTKPTDGPPVSVSFTYTQQGRVRLVKEDLGADGTIDRQMYYRYDKLGNVVGMKVTLTAGEAQETGTARLSYTCHQQP